ncbi:ankyrin repeat domain-containing protein 65-like isoform X2 [Bacillus rossius redtenbacheri]|uniref:ankyrin repeat domain-containing protein 65-like isoform X2 n=1 Tax=Bacillus rossius redtenbacheri TaxID=93214 RepID=UPI002FDEEE66
MQQSRARLRHRPARRRTHARRPAVCAMELHIEFPKEALLTIFCCLLLGCSGAANAYQDFGEVDALRSRVDECCGQMQEMSHQLQECRRLLSQDQHSNKKRSVIESLVEDFNEDGDWGRLARRLEAQLEPGSAERAELQQLGPAEQRPLTQAVDADRAALLRLLLRHGLAASAAADEHERQSMLHVAAAHGRLPAARLLLARGADLHARNRYSNTPLVEAAAGSHLALVRLLLARGADVNSAGGDGRTALHAATLHGHLAVAEFLAAAGADVDARDRWGQTALHLAASAGQSAAARLLLALGADPAARDRSGLTPLHLAAFGGHLEAARRLVGAGAPPDAADPTGQTSLHKAAGAGHLPLVRFLVQSGADLLLRDQANSSAVDLAAVEDHAAVVEFLSGSAPRAWIIIRDD